jgi:hypothetical protein
VILAAQDRREKFSILENWMTLAGKAGHENPDFIRLWA